MNLGSYATHNNIVSCKTHLPSVYNEVNQKIQPKTRMTKPPFHAQAFCKDMIFF